MTEYIQAAAAVATALVACAALWFAGGQVREMRDTRREMAQPYVVAYLEPITSNPEFVDLVVKNFGQTAAYDIRLHAMPPLLRSSDHGPEPLSVFEVLPTLVPGQSWSTYFDNGIHRKGESYPAMHEVVLEYRDSHGRQLSPSKSVLDWRVFETRSWIVEKGLPELTKSVSRIADRFLHISNLQHLNVMADDAVHSRRVARHHMRRTGQPVIHRGEAEEAYDRLNRMRRSKALQMERAGRRLRRTIPRNKRGKRSPSAD